MLIALDLAMQLEDLGHTVVGEAVDLASCQKIAMRERPDLALMDMRLKGGDSGGDVARWLRRTLDVPCLFISGNIEPEMRADLAELSPAGFIGKPLLGSRLADALADFISGRRT